MKKCPHCAMEVPAEAKVCAYCQKPIKGERSSTIVRIVMIAIVAIVIAVAASAYFSSQSDDAKTKGTRDAESYASCISARIAEGLPTDVCDSLLSH